MATNFQQELEHIIERQAQVKEYEKMGYKRAQIARMMGLSKATTKNYLDDYPYKQET